MNVEIDSKKFGKGIPYSIFYLKDGLVTEKKFSDATLRYSAVLSKKDGTYTCILADRQLAGSLLFHLYYFEGKGLQYIKPFLKESDMTKRTQIYGFEVDWEKYLNHTAAGF